MKNRTVIFKTLTLKALLLFCCFWNLTAFSQNDNKAVLKVYLTDAETGKSVKKAHVTLEGFEIPQIDGKYDKKGNYYYFSEIPKGYNTVMSYHKDYNEKGFQDLNELPKEINLNLFKKEFITYNFIQQDSISVQNKKIKFLKESYIEDYYKIAVSPKTNMSYKAFIQFLQNMISNLNLNISLVNPFFEMDLIERHDLNDKNHNGYPREVQLSDKPESFNLPLKDGYSTILYKKGKIEWSDVCFIVRKNDGSAFKRFNDPTIKSLSNHVNIFGILLNKKNSIDILNNNGNDFSIRDKENKIFNRKNGIDSSKVFYYNNNLRNYSKRTERNRTRFYIYEPTTSDDVPTFILVKNNNLVVPNELPIKPDELNDDIKISKPDASIGLGILDLYEYYSKKQL
ncbi:hypothetical protein [Flavobacterium suzhouense]|uniref:Carboxypeptidase regulatory-like domain-containing protein n=1 Tax=Flavobacterium suzhouense TaxID=1529638 RepID=A0ABW5NV16_9FLAO